VPGRTEKDASTYRSVLIWELSMVSEWKGSFTNWQSQ
jgi:hypothetical protein